MLRRDVVMLLTCCGACFPATPGPPGSPKPHQAATATRGAWVEIQTEGPSGTIATSGELLAADQDSLWVLGENGAYAIGTIAITGGVVVRYDPEASETGKFAAWGAVSTLSHGFVLVLSAPAWMLFGTGAAHGQFSEGVTRFTGTTRYGSLAPWGRFPQGIPTGLDLSAITKTPGR
jgi:hypothetical protein